MPPESSRIASLVKRASEYYPEKDPGKALPLFREAIRLAPPAPDDVNSHVEIDGGDIGFAIWAAWVCLDLLDSPDNETGLLLVEAKVKSPMTARRIKERLTEYPAKEAAEEERQANIDIVRNPKKAHIEKEIAARLLSEKAFRSGEWWELRDTAIHLAKAGLGNMAWPLFNKALLVAQSKRGNIPSIYVAMGDLCKKEKRYRDAARHYLLSIASAPNDPLKRAVEQLRISLKKAGVSGDPASIRDTLIADAGRSDPRQLITQLDAYLPPVGGNGSVTRTS